MLPVHELFQGLSGQKLNNRNNLPPFAGLISQRFMNFPDHELPTAKSNWTAPTMNSKAKALVYLAYTPATKTYKKPNPRLSRSPPARETLQ